MKKRSKRKKSKTNYIIIILIIVLTLIFLINLISNTKFQYSSKQNSSKNYCEESCQKISKENNLELIEAIDLETGCNCKFSNGNIASFGKPFIDHFKSVK